MSLYHGNDTTKPWLRSQALSLRVMPKDCQCSSRPKAIAWNLERHSSEAKAKAIKVWPRGASRTRPRPRGLHYWWIVISDFRDQYLLIWHWSYQLLRIFDGLFLLQWSETRRIPRRRRWAWWSARCRHFRQPCLVIVLTASRTTSRPPSDATFTRGQGGGRNSTTTSSTLSWPGTNWVASNRFDSTSRATRPTQTTQLATRARCWRSRRRPTRQRTCTRGSSSSTAFRAPNSTRVWSQRDDHVPALPTMTSRQHSTKSLTAISMRPKVTLRLCNWVTRNRDLIR